MQALRPSTTSVLPAQTLSELVSSCKPERDAAVWAFRVSIWLCSAAARAVASACAACAACTSDCPLQLCWACCSARACLAVFAASKDFCSWDSSLRCCWLSCSEACSTCVSLSCRLADVHVSCSQVVRLSCCLTKANSQLQSTLVLPCRASAHVLLVTECASFASISGHLSHEYTTVLHKRYIMHATSVMNVVCALAVLKMRKPDVSE